MLRLLLWALLTLVAAGMEATDDKFYRLVTSVDDLADGAGYVIVSRTQDGAYYVMQRTVSNKTCNGLAAYDTDFIGDLLHYRDGMGVFTLECYVSDNEYNGRWMFPGDNAGTYYSAGVNAATSNAFYVESGRTVASLFNITFTGNGVNIENVFHEGCKLLAYNGHFGCYNPDEVQREVSIYREVTDVYIRATSASHHYYTICLPYAVDDLSGTGATFYDVAGVTRSNGEISGIAIAEVERLEAGRPYIFYTTAAVVNLPLSAATVTTPVTACGLVGWLDEADCTVPQGCYILSGDKIRLVNGGTAYVRTGRAYLNLAGVADYVPRASQAARKVVCLNVNPDTLTAIATPHTPAPSSAVFNAAGQRVSRGSRGIIIENGRKRIAR